LCHRWERMAEVANRTVYLTEEGKEKVGHDTIHTSDERIVVRGKYIFVTSRGTRDPYFESSTSGKTYILDEDDIDYIG